jgi:hypothetical protein
VIRRIDPVGRIAYGVLCVAGMSSLAAPLLIVIAATAGIVIAVNGDISKGLLVWLGGWGFAALAIGFFFAIFYTMWPLASDWVTEWGGYALGYAIAGAGLAVMAALVFLVDIPLYLAVILPIAGTVGAGIVVAGRLAGLGAPAAQPRIPARAARRR